MAVCILSQAHTGLMSWSIGRLGMTAESGFGSRPGYLRFLGCGCVRVAVGWCDLPWRPDVALYTREYHRRPSSGTYHHGRSAYNPAACAEALSLDRTPGHSSITKSTAEHPGILMSHRSSIQWRRHIEHSVSELCVPQREIVLVSCPAEINP
jgi:hypothetical protein